jgi:hypothetical protein
VTDTQIGKLEAVMREDGSFPETALFRSDRCRILRENIARLTERGTFTPVDYEPPAEVPIEKPSVANIPKRAKVAPSRPAADR